MDEVTNSTIKKRVFTNIKEVVDTNTNSYVTRSNFSKSTSIPSIICTVGITPLSKTTDMSFTYLATVTLSCVAGTFKKAEELSQEIYNLLITNDSSFDSHKMQLHDVPNMLEPGQFTRGKNTLHNSQIVVQYVVQ